MSLRADSGTRRLLQQALRSGRWTRTHLELAESALSRSQSSRTLAAALDLCSASRGVTDAQVANLCDRPGTLGGGVACRCEAIALYNARRDLADTAFACRRRRHRAFPGEARWPTLLARANRVPLWQRAEQRDAQTLLARECALVDWLAERHHGNRPRIALVGNAPSALLGDRGRDIDACDVIVRFNNGLPTADAAAALGRRTDLHVVSPGALPALLRAGRIESGSALCLTGNPGWTRPSRYWRLVAKAGSEPLVGLPRNSWRRLATLLEAPPSAGLLLRATLADAIDADVLLHGFDPEGLEGGGRNHHADDARASSRHDFVREAALARTLRLADAVD